MLCQDCLDRVAINLENIENLKHSGNLKNYQNLRENSGKFELLQKKPGHSRKMKICDMIANKTYALHRISLS